MAGSSTYDPSMTDVDGREPVRHLDAWVTRIRADNPSPTTLSGTNTYLVAGAGGGLVVVDPGPREPVHRRRIEAAIGASAASLRAVVVTHHHADHAEAVGWAAAWGVPAFAGDPDRVPGARAPDDGAVLPVEGVTLRVDHLPGHTSDDVVLRTGDGTALCGDLVLGEGTSVIAWPDGDLDRYLSSLHRLRSLAPDRLLPGHGAPIDDVRTRLDDLIAHRHARTAQIFAALADGATTVDQMVTAVYPDLHDPLRPVAARTVTAHLVSLRRAGRAAFDGAGWHGV